MEKVFEQVIMNIQNMIDGAVADEKSSIDPIEKSYLNELIKGLEGVIYDHKDFDYVYMLSYIDIIWEIRNLFRLSNSGYSELTKYYGRQLYSLYGNITAARPQYILEIITANTKSNNMKKIKDIAIENSDQLKEKRDEYYAILNQMRGNKAIDGRVDFDRLQEEYFYAKETNKAFCSITSLSYTKFCLEYVINRACMLKGSLQEEEPKTILSLIIYRLIEVAKAPVVGVNYFELVFNTINETLSLLNNSSLETCELVVELELLLSRLNYEKEIRLKKFMENDLSVLESKELDYDELIKELMLRIKEKSDSCMRFDKTDFQWNCPSYTYADKYTYEVQTGIISQLRKLDKLFQRQMILFALKELRSDKVK